MEDRIIDLETRFAFFEDTVKELNKTILQQDKEISKLQAYCLELNKKINDIAEGDNPELNAGEKPPHY